MKKLTYILTTITFMLFPLLASATTNVNLTPVSNGRQIDTIIHFEEGFVGGLDLSLKLDGNVTFDKFNFNNEFAKNNYTTNYKYDSSKHILTIKVTTGGINTKHNLLNKDKEVNIGKIILSNKSNESTSYKLDTTSLTIIDNSWKSVNLEEINTPTKEFTYQISTSSSKDDNNSEDKEQNNSKDNEDKNNDKEQNNQNDQDNKSNDKTNNTTTNNDQSNNQTSNDKNSNSYSQSSSDKTNTNKDENNEQNNDVEDDNTDNTENNNDEENQENEENNPTDNTQTKEETDENQKSELNKKEIIIIIGVCIVIVSGAIISVIKIKK